MIKLEAIGYLGKDATVNVVGETKVINFTVAHSEKFTDKQGNKVDKTIWIECSKWGENTKVAGYMKKGTLVFVSGVPEIKQYTTQDGTAKANQALRVFEIQLLGGKKEDGENQQQPTQTKQSAAPAAGGHKPVDTGEDDLPF